MFSRIIYLIGIRIRSSTLKSSVSDPDQVVLAGCPDFSVINKKKKNEFYQVESGFGYCFFLGSRQERKQENRKNLRLYYRGELRVSVGIAAKGTYKGNARNRKTEMQPPFLSSPLGSRVRIPSNTSRIWIRFLKIHLRLDGGVAGKCSSTESPAIRSLL